MKLNKDEISENVKITFKEHKEKTIADCTEVIFVLEGLIEKIKEGDFNSFEKFWFNNGTEEGDAMIQSIREIMAIRYAYRTKLL